MMSLRKKRRKLSTKRLKARKNRKEILKVVYDPNVIASLRRKYKS